MATGLCALHGLINHVHFEAALIASRQPPPEAAGGDMILAAILVSGGLILALGFASIWRSLRHPDPTSRSGLEM